MRACPIALPPAALATALAALATALAALAPSGARAFYGNPASGGPGAELVSADYARLEQGDDRTDFAAISADGRYVVIQTRSRNFFADDDPDPPGRFRAGGLFRFDLQTRALGKVADGSVFDEDDPKHPLITRGAANPSVSGDGRFVAFSTAQQLVPADANDNVDVYVRDMNAPLGSPSAFDLVSARDGGDVPASYGPPGTPLPGGNPGAEVTRGAAISLDGSRVVFRTGEPESDLPDRAAVETPGFQVFVRDRVANTTTLVTRTVAGGEPAGGAVGSAGISGDGSTVIWTGQNAPLQTAFVNGENTDLPGFSYYLWRRIADGPAAPTRRVTGVSDPEDPACAPSGPVLFDEFTLGPCYGPLGRVELGISANNNLLPAISADGRTVAFLTNSGPRPNVGSGIGLDLFVTSMAPGATRKAATVELTREGSSGTAETAPIETVAMSGDGRYLAITTARTKFTLPTLAQLGVQRTVADTQELYVVDLQRRTVERASRSFAGGDIDSPVISEATLSAHGERIAFSSFAGNLFFGDANRQPDAFVVARQPDPAAGAPPPAPGAGGAAGTIEFDRQGPQIGVRVKPRARGALAVAVSVPAAGGVSARAKARAGAPRRLRTLATASGRAAGTARSTVRLLLEPVSRYRRELRERGAIRGRVLVAYVASRGGRRARVSVPVVMRERPLRRDRERGRG
jgi:hypothetical protein